MKHTPGPWKPISANEFAGPDYPEQGYIGAVNLSRCNDQGEPDGPANLALMLAAPKLLDRLKTALGELEYHGPESFDDKIHERNWHTMLNDIRATIAEAEGKVS